MKGEIFFAIIPGWYFILKSHYFKGIAYFTGFATVGYLALFNITFYPIWSLISIILIWIISVIDSVILYYQYNISIEGRKVIEILLKNTPVSNIDLPFYIVEFYNATKNKDSNPLFFIKAIKNLNKKELPSDWQNFIHYYANVNLFRK